MTGSKNRGACVPIQRLYIFQNFCISKTWIPIPNGTFIKNVKKYFYDSLYIRLYVTRITQRQRFVMEVEGSDKCEKSTKGQ